MSDTGFEQLSDTPNSPNLAEIAQSARDKLGKEYGRIFATQAFNNEFERARSSEEYQQQLFGEDESSDPLEFKVYRGLERKYFRTLLVNRYRGDKLQIGGVAEALDFYGIDNSFTRREAADYAFDFRTAMDNLNVAAEAERYELSALAQHDIEAAREAWTYEVQRIAQLPAYSAILQGDKRVVAQGYGRGTREEDIAIFMTTDARLSLWHHKEKHAAQAQGEAERRSVARFLELHVESSWAVLRAMFAKYYRYSTVIDYAAHRGKTVAEADGFVGPYNPQAPFSRNLSDPKFGLSGLLA